MNKQENADMLKKMEGYASRLAVAGDLRVLFKNVESIIDEIVDVQFIVLYYYNPHTNRFKAVNTKGISKSERFQAEKTAMERHPGKAWKTRQVIYLSDSDDESEELSLMFKNYTLLRSRLYIPLFKNEECIGVFSLASREANHFTEETISLLSFVTNIAAVIYKNLIETRELQRMNRRLEEINKNFLAQKLQSIGQLAAGIAHELNTPLQYISDNITFLNNAFEMMTLYVDSVNQLVAEIDNYSTKQVREILEKTIKETDIQFFIDEIPSAVCQSLDGVEKLSRIIKTIQDFAHPGVKEKTFKNINKSIEDTVLITRNEWKNLADVRLQFAEDLPLIYCRSDEISQVLLQLLINSLHAIEDKKAIDKNYIMGIIEISTCYDNAGISIYLSDDGIGIPEKNIDKIFDPFFTTKEIGKGTGQGLAIAHDVICNKHSGDIFVRSNYLKGSEFIIKLPYS